MLNPARQRPPSRPLPVHGEISWPNPGYLYIARQAAIIVQTMYAHVYRRHARFFPPFVPFISLPLLSPSPSPDSPRRRARLSYLTRESISDRARSLRSLSPSSRVAELN